MNKTKRMTAFICTVLITVTMFSPSVFAAGTDKPSEKTYLPKTMSIAFNDADIRDVLSAIAVNMGYSVVYAGDAGKITVEMKNVSPTDAFEYVLKLAGLSYLKDGNSLIVGSKTFLMGDFAKTLSLSRFRLEFITAATLTEKIKQLNIPVTVILMNSNEKTLWVQGFPPDIAKVIELARVLDVEENQSFSDPTGTNPDRKILSSLTFKYIGATAFNNFIKTLGYKCGVNVQDADKTLWIYANSAERNEIIDIKDKLDKETGGLDIASAEATTVIDMVNIFAAQAVQTINKICPELTVFTIGNSSRRIVVSGKKEDAKKAEEIIKNLDGATTSNIETTVFYYNLKHITAAEAQRRLDNITFSEKMALYVTTHDELSTTLLVYCNLDYRGDVTALLDKIDVATSADKAANLINIPVFKGKTADEVAQAQAYIQGMLNGILVGEFGTVAYGEYTVLYLKNSTPEVVKAVEALFDKTKSAETIGSTVDVSWAAFVAEVGDTVANGADGITLYGAWVKAKLGH